MSKEMSPGSRDSLDALLRAIKTFGGLPTFEQRMEAFRRSMQNKSYYETPYQVRTLDLTAANAGLEIKFEGNSFALMYLVGVNPVVNVRFAARSSDVLPLYQETALIMPFKVVYLSWPAIAGGAAVVFLTTYLGV